MSRENVETLGALEQAFNERDREAIKALLDPDAEWHPALGPLLAQPVYRGAEAVCDLLVKEMPSVIDGFRAELLHMRDMGRGTVIAEVRFAGRGRASGAPIEQVAFQVFRFREGRMTSLHSYFDEAEALEAVGLRE